MAYILSTLINLNLLLTRSNLLPPQKIKSSITIQSHIRALALNSLFQKFYLLPLNTYTHIYTKERKEKEALNHAPSANSPSLFELNLQHDSIFHVNEPRYYCSPGDHNYRSTRHFYLKNGQRTMAVKSY